MSDKLQKIKNSLSAVTPGEWNAEDIEIWKRGEDYNHEDNPHVYIGEILRAENAEFIANAPAYVGWLIEQLEQAQDKLEECMQSHERMEVECQRLKKDKLLLHATHDENYAKACERQGIIEELQAANQKLVECLEWYADPTNQYKFQEGFKKITRYEFDAGKRAEQVLQEVRHGTSKET